MSENTRWQDFNSIIDNEELTHDEKMLLLIIFRFVNNKSKLSYPSIETLKKLYGTKRNETIFIKLKSLYQKGYLIKKQGYQNRNEYTIVCPKNGLSTENVSSAEKRKEVCPKNGNEVCPRNGKQKDNKRIIKENIYSDFDSYTTNEELKIILKDFAEMRKAIKKPLTTKRAITTLINKLDNLASTDEEKKLILEQSIFNNWQGVFELKSKKQIPGQITIDNDGIRDF